MQGYDALRGLESKKSNIFLFFMTHQRSTLLLIRSYRFDNGGGHAHLRSRDRINLHQWNTIQAVRTNSKGTLRVNGGEQVIGESPGQLQQLNVDGVSYVGGIAPGWRTKYVTDHLHII